jgi:ABC-type uncharacterized transport system substrate-binding protein
VLTSVWVAARRLALGTTLIVLASAVLLVSDRGRRVTTSPAERLGKTWQIAFVQFSVTSDVEESEEGVRAGLRGSGLVEGKDYRISVRNAQGDMATVSALIDAAVVERADLIVTFSTPTLQAALGRAGRVPVVFTYLASPAAAGAGSDDRNHLPTVTGVYLEPAYEPMIAIMRRLRPGLRSIGTIYVPSEANSVHMHRQLERACKEAGLRLESMPADTSGEIGDAGLALAARQPDAICQIPGNLTAMAFPRILSAADAAHVPIFAFQGSQGRAGAVVTLSRDYHDAGRLSGELAAQIVRGTRPGDLPYQPVSRNHVIVNLTAARRFGITVPADLLAEAAEVVGR